MCFQAQKRDCEWEFTYLERSHVLANWDEPLSPDDHRMVQPTFSPPCPEVQI